MRDLLICFQAIGADLSLTHADLCADPGLLSAVAVSLFTDARAAEPDATGWAHLATFLRRWVTGPASTDKTAQSPSFVSWDWLKSYARVQDAWDELADPDYLFKTEARNDLNALLEADGLFSGNGGTFDYTGGDVVDWHDKHHQHVGAGYPVGLDGLTASLGRFALFALAKGSVAQTAEGWHIKVTGMAIFMRDNFDFEGADAIPVLELGRWDCVEKRLTSCPIGNVGNEDLRYWREAFGKGGDFHVYAVPHKVDEFAGHEYDI